MPARSIVNQNLWLQKETTPGVAATSAMKKVLGLKGRPGFTDEGEAVRATGAKVDTDWIQNNEMGAPIIEAVQDFNAFTWLLCGGFGAPGAPTQPDVATAPTAYPWDYALNAFSADPKATFTAIWGDATQAVQMLQLFFQSLQLGVQRGGSLSLSSTAMSREPTFGAAIPGAGVVDVPSKAVGQRMWDIYADDSWADLGTTKLLAAYEGNINFGTCRSRGTSHITTKGAEHGNIELRSQTRANAAAPLQARHTQARGCRHEPIWTACPPGQRLPPSTLQQPES